MLQSIALKRPPRFVADAMLGSLARKLRIFGFDTAYFAEGGDPELEALARRERRVILTSDRRLFAHSAGRGLQAILVEGKTDRARLRSIAQTESDRGCRCAWEGDGRAGARSATGSSSSSEGREAAAGRIPPKVAREAPPLLSYASRAPGSTGGESTGSG